MDRARREGGVTTSVHMGSRWRGSAGTCSVGVPTQDRESEDQRTVQEGTCF